MGQLASLIKINLNTLPLQEPDLATVKIEETKEITQQLINDIKSLTLSLGDEHLNHEDLGKALVDEVERLNKSGRVHVTILHQGNFPVLDQVRTVILFRLTQEILRYRIKKAKAKHLSILLQGLENVLNLSFSDDGRIAEEETAHKFEEGFLSVLDKRTKLINARLQMESTPLEKNGIRIELSL